MSVSSGPVLMMLLLMVGAGRGERRLAVRRADGPQLVEGLQDASLGALTTLAELLESSKPSPQQELPKNIKTYIVTKKVPVPYTVQYETRVPMPVKVAVRRPYAVYVPKPYYVEVPKPVPFPVKVPVPQPYQVEKHIPIPYKVPVDKPIPYQIAKPYPVYFEKKIPVAFEKPVPVQVKIPVERPIPVHIPIEKPVPVPVEKPVLYPVKIPVEKPVPVQMDESTFELKLKESEPQVSATKFIDFSTQQKGSNDFTPSPYDSLTSALLSQGKQQKVISFLPGGSQNWPFTTQNHISFEAPHVSEQSSVWSPVNSTNDWVPRYVNSAQNNIFHGSQKYVPQHYTIPESKASSQHLTFVEAKPVQKDNVQPPLKIEVHPTFQSEPYNFFPTNDKSPKYEGNSFGLIPQESKKVERNGNYQFFNVHSTQGTKSEPQVSGVSFQKYESDQKSAGQAQWIQNPEEYQQNKFQDHHILGQQIKKEDVIPQPTTNSLQNQAKDFNPHDYHQYKLYYQGPDQDHFQVKQHLMIPSNYKTDQLPNLFLQEHTTQPTQIVQQENSPQENQFNNQNFPQLQQYQQQISSQPQSLQQRVSQNQQEQNQHFQQQAVSPTQQYQEAQQAQQISNYDQGLSYTTQQYHSQEPQFQPLDAQYLHQTVIRAHSLHNQYREEEQGRGQGSKPYHGSHRRRQVQRSSSHRQQSASTQAGEEEPQKAARQRTTAQAEQEAATLGATTSATPESTTTRSRRPRRRNRKRNNPAETDTTTTTTAKSS